ncbi:hypothetical protein P5663_07025 [Priestia flexa]|uniref:hypothetical protein n=1 Tax=Priestia flexa TaxID=86664 RepID=UPI00240E1F00|nr:hypothetical protein [Priestia flexa]WEZ09587.1 hypothetical protein P5663_07025 [Priestia flexa]
MRYRPPRNKWGADFAEDYERNLEDIERDITGVEEIVEGSKTNAEQALTFATEAKGKAESVQAQFNQVIIEGDSSVEAAQARVDTKNVAQPTLKARLDNDYNEVTAQLAESAKLAVNLENYNPDGTGITNSLQSFTEAISHAKLLNNVASLPIPIKIAPGTYRIIKNSDLEIPSLICDGFATIIVEDPYAFIVSSNFTLSNVRIVSTNVYSKTTDTFRPIFKATSQVENITFSNVVFDSELPISDGSVRASQCANFKAIKNFRLNNITVRGYRHGFTVDGLSENIKGNMLHFENVELPIYVRGSSPTVTDENYAKNIQFSNISHINTQAQRNNYFKLQGADTFLLEKCDTITITNVISENPIERSCYSSSCRNAVYHGWNLKNALGIKFVGGSNSAINLNIIADNCSIYNINAVFEDPTLSQQGYIAEFYWAKDWSVKSCRIEGNNIASSIVSTMHHFENGLVEDCYGENLKRGLFEYSYVGDIVNPEGTISAGNYVSGVNGLTVRKNTVKNSNTLDYNVVRLTDVNPPPIGTYRYQNVLISDNRVYNHPDNYGHAEGVNCKGLVNINSVQNLRIERNQINGYTSSDSNGNPISLPFQVGSNSRNVYVKHTENLRNQDFKYNWGTLYLSAPSVITFNTANTTFSYHDTAVVTLNHNKNDSYSTKNIASSYRISGKMFISDATDFNLTLIGSHLSGYTLPAIFGTLDIISDSGDVGGYIISKTNNITVKTGSSSLFVLTTTDGKLALMKDSTLPRYTIRYKLGVLSSFILEYSLAT